MQKFLSILNKCKTRTPETSFLYDKLRLTEGCKVLLFVCFVVVVFSTIFFISKNVTDHCFSCIKITFTALKSERQTMTRN